MARMVMPNQIKLILIETMEMLQEVAMDRTALGVMVVVLVTMAPRVMVTRTVDHWVTVHSGMVA